MTPQSIPPSRPTRFWPRGAAWTLGLVCAGWLTACGPGVGGTGTGQEHSAADFGAVTAPLCTSSLADQLLCPPELNGQPAAVGSLPVVLADANPPRRAAGSIDGSRIELNLFCEGWAFFGEWGVAMREPGGRFYGTARGPGGSSQPAVLLLAGQSGGGFQASLQDVNGRLLVPSVALQVVVGSLGAQVCGP